MRALTACLTIAAVVGAPAPALGRALVSPPAAPIELDWGADRRPRPQDVGASASEASAGHEAGGAATAVFEPAQDPPTAEPAAPADAGSPRRQRAVPPPTVAAATAAAGPPMLVAIGLGADAPGSREEWAILDRLERGLLASTEPRAELRRLRTPVSAPRRVCRETGAALVISVSYVAQRLDPLLAAWDCDLDLELGRWAATEAESPDLLVSIWSEHEDAIQRGEAIAGARGRPKLPPKVRTGLIAGGVVLALGATLAILLAAGLREDRVVLTVRP